MKVYQHPKPGKKKKSKPKNIVRDKEYLEFIRSQPCLITGQLAEPHHVDIDKSSGMGIKCSDLYTIPLNNEKHTEAHTIGKYTFAKKYGIDYTYEISRLQQKYKRLNKCLAMSDKLY